MDHLGFQVDDAAELGLILCKHNSARSVLSEGMLNYWADMLGKHVRACSAGSAPSGRINPFALKALGSAGVDTSGLRFNPAVSAVMVAQGELPGAALLPWSLSLRARCREHGWPMPCSTRRSCRFPPRCAAGRDNG
ncbi:hypothetical protein [Cupriavidus necator]|uniref:arsenate reductase/protein-tyrosine-phosphatase family protein n=1 Tax=Cupriavidus necator TaxID=106590 RepID=UPI00339D72C2